jgi:hypothetical protein
MLLKWHEPQLRGFALPRDHAFYPKLELSVSKLADKTMKLAPHFLQNHITLAAVIEFSWPFTV